MRWPNGTQTQPRISSPFGPRSGGAYSVHYGVDFIGFSNIINVAPGKVTFAGWMNSAAGNTVAVDIGGGTTLVYMHLASVAVARGANVAEGVKLGVMGRTGNATGACLHFEVRVNGKSIEPTAWVRARLGGAPASSSSSVRWAQERLKAHGFNPGTIDGIRGTKTVAAVRAFQKARRLTVDGIVGPKTTAALKAAPPAPKPAASKRPTIRKGATGQAVRDLQSRLKSNYAAYAGRLVVDGVFGPKVDAAVREFQRRAGLKVDGIVGPATWARLGL